MAVVPVAGSVAETDPLPSKVAVVDPPRVRRNTSDVAVAVAPTTWRDAVKEEPSTVPAAAVEASIVTPPPAPPLAASAPVFN